jgi:hypothetical protein
MDDAAARGGRGVALVADERHLARGIRELVRADRRERDCIAIAADAALPGVCRAVLALERRLDGHGAAQLDEQAWRRLERILEDVVDLRLQCGEPDRPPMDVHQPRLGISAGR